ncbi:MAG: AmmeMemoRadiSam system protein A [Thermodesulfobacteriota bacterium]
MALTEDEKRAALSIARGAITRALDGSKDKAAETSEEHKGLKAPLGLFVTLHKAGSLRGCIGNFTSDTPLYENIKDMACAAAFNDPRFTPVSLEELPSIHIEISVLSPLREIKDINEIEVGRHGIFIQRGYSRGVLLPQVAVENGFDRETFLEHTCMKAGLSPGCWKEDVKISIFEADIFSETP